MRRGAEPLNAASSAVDPIRSRCFRRGKGRAVPEHGFFDLLGNDGAYFPQVFAGLLDFLGHAGQELEVAFQLAGGALELAALGVVALHDEVVDQDLLGPLAVAVEAAVALLIFREDQDAGVRPVAGLWLDVPAKPLEEGASRPSVTRHQPSVGRKTTKTN